MRSMEHSAARYAETTRMQSCSAHLFAAGVGDCGVDLAMCSADLKMRCVCVILLCQCGDARAETYSNGRPDLRKQRCTYTGACPVSYKTREGAV
jgi:hypothetical protein